MPAKKKMQHPNLKINHGAGAYLIRLIPTLSTHIQWAFKE